MKYNLYREKRILKRIICLALMVAMIFGTPALDGYDFSQITGKVTVFATTAKEKKEQAEKDKEEVEDQIDDLKDQKSSVASDLSEKAAELQTLLANQKKVKSQIEDKQDELDQCNADLEEAQNTLQEEYDSMKKRIKFMYENGTSDSVWTAIIESKGISDMLNRIEYVSDVYQSDRKLMTNYQNSVAEVEALNDQLEEDMEDLVALQESYESQQGDLEQVIAELQAQKDQYATEIAEAEDQADEYQKVIDEQGAIIRAQEASAAGADSNYGGGGSGSGGVSESVDYLSDSSCNPSPATSVSGTDVVNYALQFCGNKYVWGGNSLTEGCDCSGFVHLVFKHFGISTPRYSQAFKSGGQAVAFCNIQAGDVVIYPGHVAIYIGNGCIVEAQSTKAGITSYRSVQCHTITGIRRYV